MRRLVRPHRISVFLAALAAVLGLVPASLPVEAQKPARRDLKVQEVKELPAKSKRYALVIGVDEYQDTQISPLSGAANDARALAEALVKYAGFAQDQVILLASDQPLERRPTRGNILRRLSNLRGLVPADGLLLVSFAGHGMERGGRGFLCPTDAQISGDMALLEDTAIPVEALRDRIHQTGVKQVVVILDACRNDPSGRGEAENKLTASYARQFNFDVRNREVTAFATLYATEVGSVAYEYKEKKQGYFTWALVEGLKGAAANDQGEVTLAGLRQYLEQAVPKQVRLDLGQEKKQRPWAEIQGYKADELVLSVTVRVALQPGRPTAGVDPAAVELSFWESIKGGADPDDFKEYLKQYPDGRFAGLARNRLKNLAAATKPRQSSSQSDAWMTKAPMPTARSGVMTAVVGGLLYVVGGNNGTRDAPTLEVYDPTSNSWSSKAPLPQLDTGNAGRYGGAVGVIDGKLYLVGGWRTSPPLPTSSLQVYDPAANTWSARASLPILSACSGAGVIAGKLYVLTACNGFSGYFNFLHVYDPATDSWTSAASSPHTHVDAAVGVIADKFYVAGGADSNGAPSGALDIYDPSLNAWTTGASMPTVRSGAASGVINGRLYAVGGTNGRGLSGVVEAYDPRTNSWAAKRPMPTPRASLGGGVIGDSFYAVGGANGAPLNTLEVYGLAAPATAGH